MGGQCMKKTKKLGKERHNVKGKNERKMTLGKSSIALRKLRKEKCGKLQPDINWHAIVKDQDKWKQICRLVGLKGRGQKGKKI